MDTMQDNDTADEKQNVSLFRSTDYVPFLVGLFVIGGCIVFPLLWLTYCYHVGPAWRGSMFVAYLDAIAWGVASCLPIGIAFSRNGSISWRRGGPAIVAIAIFGGVLKYCSYSQGFVAGGILGAFVAFACGYAGIGISRAVFRTKPTHESSSSTLDPHILQADWRHYLVALAIWMPAFYLALRGMGGMGRISSWHFLLTMILFYGTAHGISNRAVRIYVLSSTLVVLPSLILSWRAYVKGGDAPFSRTASFLIAMPELIAEWLTGPYGLAGPRLQFFIIYYYALLLSPTMIAFLVRKKYRLYILLGQVVLILIHSGISLCRN